MRFIKNCGKSFILRSDMFAAQPTLRFNGQSSYETIFGGCLSILLVIGFAAIFGASFIKVLEKVNVTASLNLEDNPYNENKITDIRMAIGIKDIDFTLSQRYFNLVLKRKVDGLGGPPSATQIALSPCNIDDWKDLGEHFQKLFSIYKMQKMLCPSVSQNLTLNGFAGSQEWITMEVLVEQCRMFPGVSYTCYNQVDLNNKFNQQLQANDFFKVNLLVLNTVISPQQQDATKLVLENQIFLTFSNTSGSRGQIKLGRYTIQTDNSIWPVSDLQEEEGYYIADHQTYTIGLYSTHYVRIQIQKARTVYQVTRQHDKFDEMLSYVGGLFALLFGWIVFFIGSYNQYKYELAVAQHAFALDQTGRKIKQDQFGFMTYLKYAVFDWIKTFNIPIAWKKMEQIDAARGQANQQMDVRYLMKKIQRFQTINKFLLGEHNLILANLTRPPTLDQVRKLRKITQYYDKVIKKENQEDLLSNIFRMMNKSKVIDETTMQNQIKMAQRNKIDEEIQLDSQDEDIQKQIAQIYKQSCKEQQNQMIKTLVQEVPHSMRNRLTKINYTKDNQQNLQTQEKDLVKMDQSKIKIESSFTLNQNSTPPSIFLSMIQQKGQN